MKTHFFKILVIGTTVLIFSLGGVFAFNIKQANIHAEQLKLQEQEATMQTKTKSADQLHLAQERAKTAAEAQIQATITKRKDEQIAANLAQQQAKADTQAAAAKEKLRTETLSKIVAAEKAKADAETKALAAAKIKADARIAADLAAAKARAAAEARAQAALATQQKAAAKAHTKTKTS